MKNFDLIVVGAGIIGLSIAFQVVRRSGLRVLVLEKGAAVGEGSTGASSAVCRHRYTAAAMVRFASEGIQAYRQWQEFTGLKAPRAEFQADGVLWMPGSDTDWAEREHIRMSALGVATTVLDDAALTELFPALSTCGSVVDVEHGADHDCRGGAKQLLELEGGYMDPVAAAQDLVDAITLAGGEVRFNSEVSSVLLDNGRVSGVHLGSGESLHCGQLVNATGPWCNRLNESAGLELRWPLVPTRIQIMYLERPDQVVGKLPVTVDMENGIYFRTQNRGQQLVLGSVLEADEREEVTDPDEFDRFVDEAFQLRKLHALHHRIPSLPYTGAISGYCGLYTVNREDVHPVIGPTAVPGYMLANGFSGHGFKLAPAVGALVAKQLCGSAEDFDTDISVDFFSVGRTPIIADSKSVLA
ncbi:MAG: FAD-dependent oxidoreductase [Halioglobus sp.]